MVLLLPPERRAPLPVQHCVCTVGYRVPGHGACFAFVQRVVERCPVDVARLGFD
jgi:hypothetical protein